MTQLAEYGVRAAVERIVVDEHIITSSNPGTAMDVAFLLLEMLTSKDNTEKVRDLMGFNMSPQNTVK